MLKKLKKMFSVDPEELDLKDIEEAFNDKATLYKEDLNQNNTNEIKLNNFDNTDDKLKVINNTQDNILKEMEVVNQNKINSTTENIVDLVKNNVVQEIEIENTPRRSFDFEKEIENAYGIKTTPIKEEKKVEEVVEVVEEVTKKDAHDIISKDEYVLKDIISPMHGIVRKENKVIKKEEEVKKAEIIKLREKIKTTEIEEKVEEPIEELVTFPFSDTKELSQGLDTLPKLDKKDTLSETSKFTLIEDSTGEMRLVIDEDN